MHAGAEGTTAPERLDDSFFQDPQGLFARLRSSSPVTPVITTEGVRVWLVTRYEDVRAALADPRVAKDWVAHMTPEDFDINVDPVQAYLDQHMLNLDPPDHTRLRRLVVKAFTPRRVAALRPRISAVTDELLDAMADGPAQTELIEAFAFPLSVTVICELIGIPVGDRASFRAWSETLLSSRGTRKEARAAAVAMYEYFTGLVTQRRTQPADDLLSALIAARDSGDSLSEHELLSMMFLLLVAGHETMLNLITNGTLALLTHPGELKRLRDDPALLPSAVEELLRYANPLNHATERFTLEPVTIGGVTVPAKEWVMLASASANWDPTRFPDADRLDVDRDRSGHLGFGHGIHYCLGAPLARLEGEIAFGSLLARFPELRLAVPESVLRWRPSSLIHGLEGLPVRLR
ncbi:cytochrome P450 [Streptomyces kunmingensis]|uniref:Cytochrome P450 n=1 Tax=Streptomyces kunmingensis TaxID=68225 RepID=A0ABU6CN99_9ACTN|nr:cytochrome P450 [Streptomyces kunmingensis]MEB3966188.1 cytochrome P450 [Streptomyces kunmingensis]